MARAALSRRRLVGGLGGLLAAVRPANPRRSTPQLPMFDPEISLDCYVATVDAEVYHGVVLRFADGSTVGFDGEYSGRQRFGFVGDGRIDPDDPGAIEAFHGPIERVTVRAWDRSETVDRAGDCTFESLRFDCETVVCEPPADLRLRFTDGSVKQWDPPDDPTRTRFGSPGRVVDRVTEATSDISVQNPEPDCEPGPPATVFEDGAVTVGSGEFGSTPTFESARLVFADGSERTVEPEEAREFTAPTMFTVGGSTPIAAVAITRRDGDVTFQLVNPAVDGSG
ncbi:hypothetical protein [Halohasta salina]|uniref:hypothetical protein n=1 Tax=Halohasta salina TaxID=2961621 RepID=UPI0020A40090|nr:hypothetical protein [Halohasta salina]